MPMLQCSNTLPAWTISRAAQAAGGWVWAEWLEIVERCGQTEKASRGEF
jgi:hypothetical protein